MGNEPVLESVMIDKCLSPFKVQNMAYKVLFFKRWNSVKELCENLSLLRKNNGIGIEEASNDLGITDKELECLENGNFKVFKDVYEFKRVLSNYAKYLGLDEKRINDEFSDFLFEKTSRISKEEIEMAIKDKEEKEERVSSPYTKVTKTRYNYAPIVLLMVILVFISLVVYLILASAKGESKINRELQKEECYELA